MSSSNPHQPLTRRQRREAERAQQAAERAKSLHDQAVTDRVISTPDTLTQAVVPDSTAHLPRADRWSDIVEQAEVSAARRGVITPAAPDADQQPQAPETDQAADAEPFETVDPFDIDDAQQYSEFEDEEDFEIVVFDDLHDDEDLDDEDLDDEDAEHPPTGYLAVAQGEQDHPDFFEYHRMIQRKQRSKRRTMVMLTAMLMVIVGLVGVGIGFRSLIPGPAKDYPGPGEGEVIFTVNPGEGQIVIGNRLVEEDIVASTRAFRDAIESTESDREIQPGDYELKYQMSANDAAEVLLRVGESPNHYVPVNSGRRIDEVFEDIAEATEFSVEDLKEAASDPTAFGLPEDAVSLEGYIAVGEYRFPTDASAAEILELMVEPTLEELESKGITDPAEQYRTVTIASILEAEALPDDRNIVAGIIDNRLDRDNQETHGLLQIDATVIYGMGVRQLQFSADDREDESNEYNTYVHRGLPPGPIGAPSLNAIDAAANPEANEYFYWITTNIETGETKFSKTYAQHQKYQEEYRQYCRENEDICGVGDQGTTGDAPEDSDD